MVSGRGLRILGIDPGTFVVGYGCLELGDSSGGGAAKPARQAMAVANAISSVPGHGRLRLVDSGTFALGRRTTPIEDRLFALGTELARLLDRLKVDEVALEEAFYKKSVSSALRIGEARGVILAGCRAKGLSVRQFAPARIKRAVAGHGGASKDAVARMVCHQLAVPMPTGTHDVTDALAVAFCRASEWGENPPRPACNPVRPDV